MSSVVIHNAPGLDVLAGTVAPPTFCGSPIVLFGSGISLSDPRWAAMLSFSIDVGAQAGKVAPLIGIDPSAGSYSADLATIVSALSAGVYTSLFTPRQDRPFVWADNAGIVRPAPICGPIFSIPTPGVSDVVDVDVLSDGLAAYQASALFVRLTCAHLYGVGLFACGSAVPEVRPSPPVYSLAGSGYSTTLRRLQNVWQRGGPTVASNVAALQAAEADPARLGISRRTHPALVPYLVLSAG